MIRKALVIILILIIAISLFKVVTDNRNKPLPSDSAQNSKSPVSMSIVLAEQNSSGTQGIATIKDMKGKVEVVIKLAGPESENVLSSSILKGDCNNPGDEAYNINDIGNGESTTILEESMDDLSQKLPLILSVYSASFDADTAIACGSITR